VERQTSAAKILVVLETLCLKGDSGISELSRQLNLGKSSAHRFLSILTRSAFAEKDKIAGKYRATLKLFEIGAFVRGRDRLINIARRHMEEIGNEFKETVNLAFLDRYEVVYIDKVESIQTLRTDLVVGRRVPAYCTALGKVFLAYLSEEDLNRYCNETQFMPFTRKTITSAKELKKALETVRKERVAIDNKEFDEGIRCIAAPISDNSGKVVACMSVSGPSSRLIRERLGAIKKSLTAVTTTISRRLGYINLG